MTGVILSPSFEADELAAYLDERHDADVAAFEADAAQSTRDDGYLFHGRLPADDADAFNLSITARTQILPPALPAWMERRHGGDPIGTGLPAGWEVAS